MWQEVTFANPVTREIVEIADSINSYYTESYLFVPNV